MNAIVSHIEAMMQKLLKAWDPDYTKLTSREKRSMLQAEKEMKNGEYYTSEEVWENLQ